MVNTEFHKFYGRVVKSRHAGNILVVTAYFGGNMEQKVVAAL